MSNINLPIAELKPALTGLGKVITRASTLPVLKMVAIERTRDGWITLTATDLDTCVTVRLEEPAKGEPGVILIGYEDLVRITKRCQRDESITVDQVAGDKALIRFPIGNQSGEEHLESLPSTEFPPVPKIRTEPISLPDEVRGAIREAFECSSEDETRRILNGVYIDVSDPSCHQVVATDGRQLYGSNSFTLPLKNSVIIPAHRFLEWKEFNNDGEWQLRADDKSQLLQISSRRWRFITRQIEGNFPNWRQVVPREDNFNTSVKFTPALVETILALIPRIPCHDPVNNTLGLIIQDRKLMLRGRGANDTKWTDLEVEGATVKGTPVTIYLNRSFISKALRFGMNEIQIIDSLSPLRLASGGKQMIIMPVRGQDPASAAPTETTASAANIGNETAEASQVTPPIPAEELSTERRNTTMANTTINGSVNGANGHAAPAKAALDSALEQVEALRGSLKDAIRGLGDLGDQIRQAQRDQRSNEREVQSVRTTLEKLQAVRI